MITRSHQPHPALPAPPRSHLLGGDDQRRNTNTPLLSTVPCHRLPRRFNRTSPAWFMRSSRRCFVDKIIGTRSSHAQRLTVDSATLTAAVDSKRMKGGIGSVKQTRRSLASLVVFSICPYSPLESTSCRMLRQSGYSMPNSVAQTLHSSRNWR